MDDRNPLSLLRSVREELQTVQRKVDYLVAVLDSQPTDGSERTGRPGDTGRPLDLDLINRALQQMIGKHSQEEILEVLLNRAGECADRAILFDSEDGKLLPWKGAGIATDLLSGFAVVEANSPLVVAAHTGKVVLENAPFEGALPWLSRLGPLPAMCLCVPLTFGSYVPIVLYADSSSELDAGSLELLGRLAVLTMQNHYLAHLLQQGEGRDRGSQRGAEEGPEGESVQDREDEAWSEAELVGGEAILKSAGLTEEEEEAAHAEARRLARLLVAEIKLYNEEEVEEGRQHADLYRRLRTDIERSRKMYDKLVHPSVKSRTDYYGAELIRVLTQDDPQLMGSDYNASGVSSPISQEIT